MKEKYWNSRRIQFGIFVFICVSLFVSMYFITVKYSNREYLLFGESGYTEYRKKTGETLLLNNGQKPYYVTTKLWTEAGSIIRDTLQVNPGDSVVLEKHVNIEGQWKNIDVRGNLIGLNDIHCVGYFDKNRVFHKKD